MLSGHIHCSLSDLDAGSFQVIPDPEAGFARASLRSAALCLEIAQTPESVLWAPVAQKQYVRHVGHLPKSPPSPHR